MNGLSEEEKELNFAMAVLTHLTGGDEPHVRSYVAELYAEWLRSGETMRDYIKSTGMRFVADAAIPYKERLAHAQQLKDAQDKIRELELKLEAANRALKGYDAMGLVLYEWSKLQR